MGRLAWLLNCAYNQPSYSPMESNGPFFCEQCGALLATPDAVCEQCDRELMKRGTFLMCPHCHHLAMSAFRRYFLCADFRVMKCENCGGAIQIESNLIYWVVYWAVYILGFEIIISLISGSILFFGFGLTGFVILMMISLLLHKTLSFKAV